MKLTFPSKILVVESVVLIQSVEVIGQVFDRVEIVDVDEGIVRRVELVVGARSAHHHRHDVGHQRVDVELLGDVVAAVGILEGQVELVVFDAVFRFPSTAEFTPTISLLFRKT